MRQWAIRMPMAHWLIPLPHCPIGSLPHYALLGLFMSRVLPTEPAELVELQPLGTLLPVLRCAVVAALALGARQRHDFPHHSPQRSGKNAGPSPEGGPGRSYDCYAMMSVIVPAPTVRPPSRIANRLPFSMATGAISSPVIVVLSPGITISTPSGRFNVPVTSVVRM